MKEGAVSAVSHPPAAIPSDNTAAAAHASHTSVSETLVLGAGCPLLVLALRAKTALGFYINNIFIILAPPVPEPAKQLWY